MTNAHLIPECIGGHLSFKFVCQECNSVIGHSIEGKLKAHLYFAQSIAEVGLQPKEKAYERIKIRTQDTNQPLQYVGDELVFQPGVNKDGNLYGPVESIVKRASKQLRETRPHWINHYQSEIRQGKSEVRISDKVHKIVRSTTTGPVVFEGIPDFPYELLAKITYEAMRVFWPFKIGAVAQFAKDTFEIFERDGKISRIEIKEEFKRKVDDLSDYYLYRADRVIERPAASPQHRIDFRLTPKGIGVVRIEFFGNLPFTVAIGPAEISEPGKEFVNLGAVFFDVVGRGYTPEPYDLKNETMRTNRETEDIRAQLRYDGFL